MKQKDTDNFSKNGVLDWVLDPTNKTRLYLVVAVFSFLFFGGVSVWLGQDNNWDLRNYHFYNPFALLHNRLAHDYAPAQLQTYHNPILDLLFYFLVQYLKPVFVGFLLGGLQGLNFFLVFAIAYELYSHVGFAFITSCVGMYGPVMMKELGSTYNDSMVGLFVLAGLLILVKKSMGQDKLVDFVSSKKIILTGLLLGAGAGLKLTLIVYVLGYMIALITIKTDTKSRSRLVVIYGLTLIAGLLITRGFWMTRLWLEYGNPIFPYYNEIFRSPYYELHNFVDKKALPGTILNALVYPFQFVSQNNLTSPFYFRDARYAIVYCLLIFFSIKMLIFWYRKSNIGEKKLYSTIRFNGQERFLIIFFIASYIIWQIKFSIIRYTAPLEVLAPMIIFILSRKIFPTDKWHHGTVAVTFVSIIVLMEPLPLERLPWSSKFFNVEVPQVSNPENTIIIIAQDHPFSYLIPFFQPEIRFIGINNNFTSPKQMTKMQTEMRALIRDHNGSLYLLSRIYYLRPDFVILEKYSLSITNTFLLIKSKHDYPDICLWNLVKQ